MSNKEEIVTPDFKKQHWKRKKEMKVSWNEYLSKLKKGQIK